MLWTTGRLPWSCDVNVVSQGGLVGKRLWLLSTVANELWLSWCGVVKYGCHIAIGVLVAWGRGCGSARVVGGQ